MKQFLFCVDRVTHFQITHSYLLSGAGFYAGPPLVPVLRKPIPNVGGNCTHNPVGSSLYVSPIPPPHRVPLPESPVPNNGPNVRSHTSCNSNRNNNNDDSSNSNSDDSNSISNNNDDDDKNSNHSGGSESASSISSNPKS